MTTFHELVRAREAPARTGRAPAADRVSAEPRVPFEGPLAKWWAVEVRFDRGLTRRQVRVLERAYAGWATERGPGMFGADGMVWSQWWNSWPSADQDGASLVATMRRVRIPGVVRVAPFGRDCPGAWSCPSGLGAAERCELGTAWSCSPVFKHSDWIPVWPDAWRAA